MDLNQIRQTAEELAKQYNPQNLVPFPFENIEKDKQDVKIYFAPLSDEISGSITYEKKEKRFNILINTNKPRTRQYFTVAHEMAHYFLHQEIFKNLDIIIDGDNNIDSTSMLYRASISEGTQIEIEANNFAASILMPTELVIRAWNVFKSVEECAKFFQVSVSAMSIRLEKLNLLN